MSHFVVLVVDKTATSAHEAEANLEEILAPYDENMEVMPYPSWQSPDEVDRAVEFYRDNPQFCPGDSDGPIKPFDEFVGQGDLDALREWTRQAVGSFCANDRNDGIYDADKDRYGYASTYNPDSRWDWWTVGGRWHGFFLLKSEVSIGALRRTWPAVGDGVTAENQIEPLRDGHDAILGHGGVMGDHPDEDFTSRADVARKGAIDFEAARLNAAQKASEIFDKLEAAIKGLTPVDFQTFVQKEYDAAGIDKDGFAAFVGKKGERTKEEWDAHLEQRRKEFNAPLDRAREAYRNDPFVVALREADLLGWFGSPIEDYCLDAENPREAFIQSQVDGVFTPYAMVVDGQWIAKGQMGWFGMSNDAMTDNEWARQVNHLIDGLPDDAYISAVDCHI